MGKKLDLIAATKGREAKLALLRASKFMTAEEMEENHAVITGEYEVQLGDDIFSLAEKFYGNQRNFIDLAMMNWGSLMRNALGDTTMKLRAGTKLFIPRWVGGDTIDPKTGEVKKKYISPNLLQTIGDISATGVSTPSVATSIKNTGTVAGGTGFHPFWTDENLQEAQSLIMEDRRQLELMAHLEQNPLLGIEPDGDNMVPVDLGTGVEMGPWAPDPNVEFHDRDRLYYNEETGQITNEKTPLPLYHAEAGGFTVNETSVPALYGIAPEDAQAEVYNPSIAPIIQAEKTFMGIQQTNKQILEFQAWKRHQQLISEGKRQLVLPGPDGQTIVMMLDDHHPMAHPSGKVVGFFTGVAELAKYQSGEADKRDFAQAGELVANIPEDDFYNPSQPEPKNIPSPGLINVVPGVADVAWEFATDILFTVGNTLALYWKSIFSRDTVDQFQRQKTAEVADRFRQTGILFDLARADVTLWWNSRKSNAQLIEEGKDAFIPEDLTPQDGDIELWQEAGADSLWSIHGDDLGDKEAAQVFAEANAMGMSLDDQIEYLNEEQKKILSLTPEEYAQKTAEIDGARERIHNMVANGGDIELAKQLMMEVQRKERQRPGNTMDHTYAYTWAHGKKGRALAQQYFEALALAELQAGRPLLWMEQIAIKEHYVDPEIENIGENLIDPLNLIPAGLTTKYILGPSKGVAKLLFGQLDEAMLAAGKYSKSAIPRTLGRAWMKGHDLKMWMSAHAARSVNATFDKNGRRMIQGVLSTQGGTLDDAVRHLKSATVYLDEYADNLARAGNDPGAKSAAFQTLKDQLQKNLSQGFFSDDQVRHFIQMAELIPTKNWDAAIGAAQTEMRQMVEDQVRRSAKLPFSKLKGLTGEELKAAIDKEVNHRLKSNIAISKTISSAFSQAQLQKFKPWRGSHLMTDDLTFKMFEAFGWVEQLADGAKWKIVDGTKGTVARFINSAQRMYAMFNNFWTMSVLQSRPGWFVYNVVDSTYRFMIHGGSLFSNLGAMAKSLLDDDIPLPSGLGGFFGTHNITDDVTGFIAGMPSEMLTGRSGVSVYSEMIAHLAMSWGGDLKKILGKASNNFKDKKFFQGIGNILELGFGIGETKGALTGDITTAAEFIGATNSMLEFGLRTRLYYSKFMKNVEVLDPSVLQWVLGSLPEHLQPLVSDVWHASGNNADRFKAMIANMGKKQVKGVPGWTFTMPPQIRQKIYEAYPGRGAMIFKEINDTLFDRFKTLKAAGKEPKMADVVEFMDEVRQSLIDRANTILKDQEEKLKLVEMAAEGVEEGFDEITEASLDNTRKDLLNMFGKADDIADLSDEYIDKPPVFGGHIDKDGNLFGTYRDGTPIEPPRRPQAETLKVHLDEEGRVEEVREALTNYKKMELHPEMQEAVDNTVRQNLEELGVDTDLEALQAEAKRLQSLADEDFAKETAELRLKVKERNEEITRLKTEFAEKQARGEISGTKPPPALVNDFQKDLDKLEMMRNPDYFHRIEGARIWEEIKARGIANEDGVLVRHDDLTDAGGLWTHEYAQLPNSGGDGSPFSPFTSDKVRSAAEEYWNPTMARLHSMVDEMIESPDFLQPEMLLRTKVSMQFFQAGNKFRGAGDSLYLDLMVLPNLHIGMDREVREAMWKAFDDYKEMGFMKGSWSMLQWTREMVNKKAWSTPRDIIPSRENFLKQVFGIRIGYDDFGRAYPKVPKPDGSFIDFNNEHGRSMLLKHFSILDKETADTAISVAIENEQVQIAAARQLDEYLGNTHVPFDALDWVRNVAITRNAGDVPLVKSRKMKHVAARMGLPQEMIDKLDAEQLFDAMHDRIYLMPSWTRQIEGNMDSLIPQFNFKGLDEVGYVETSFFRELNFPGYYSYNELAKAHSSVLKTGITEPIIVTVDDAGKIVGIDNGQYLVVARTYNLPDVPVRIQSEHGELFRPKIFEDVDVEAIAREEGIERLQGVIPWVRDKKYVSPESAKFNRAKMKFSARENLFQGITRDLTPEEAQDMAEAWKIYVHAHQLDKFSTNHKDFESYESFVRFLNEKLDILEADDATFDQPLASAMRRQLYEVETGFAGVAHWRYPEVYGYAPGKIASWNMSQSMQTWMGLQENVSAELTSLLGIFDEWVEWMEKNPGQVFSGLDLDVDDTKFLLEWVDDLGAPAKQELIDVANFGGSHSRVGFLGDFQGASASTAKEMLDYETYSRFDKMMKNIIPFWMFTSRSAPYWVETLANRPKIAAFYSKYMHHSRRRILQEGLVDRNGDPLPSLIGYVPIPGTDMWVNPTAPLSLRYVFQKRDPVFADHDVEYEESGAEAMYRRLHELSWVWGLGLAPWVPLTASLLKIDNTTEKMYLFPQLQLVAPWTMRKIENSFLGSFPLIGDNIHLEVSWMDYLIEQEVLKTLMRDMQAPGLTVDQQLEMAQKISWLFQNKSEDGKRPAKREDWDIWNEARLRVEGQHQARNTLGYFTGIYAKPYTSGDLELRALKQDMNAMKLMVNNIVGADLFGFDEDIQQRDEFWKNTRYNLPQGAIYGLTNAVSYTWLDGKQLRHDKRRTHIAEGLMEAQRWDDYFTAIDRIERNYAEILDNMPFGTPYEERSYYLDKKFAALSSVKNQYADILSAWAPGSKSDSAIFDHYTDLFYRELRSTKPPRYEGQDYQEWRQLTTQWQEELTLIALSQQKEWLTTLDRDGLGLPGLTEDMVRMITDNLDFTKYEMWRLSKNDMYDDMDDAWFELYYKPYHEVTGGTKKTERMLRHENYLRQYQPPTPREIFEWIDARQPGKYTLMDIELEYERIALENEIGIPGLEAEDWLRAGKTVEESKEEQIWHILSWAGGGEGLKIFKEEANLKGVSKDEFNLWYGTQGQSSTWTEEEFERIFQVFQEVANEMGLRPPTAEELEQRAKAEELNQKFTDMMKGLFGENFYEKMGQYYDTPFGSDFRARFEAENDELMEVIKNYNALKNMYAYNSPDHMIWAFYYNPDVALGQDGFVPDVYQSYTLSRLGPSLTQKVYLYNKGLYSLTGEERQELSRVWESLGGRDRTGSVESWIRNNVAKELEMSSLYGDLDLDKVNNGLPEEISPFTQWELEQLYESEGDYELSPLAQKELHDIYVEQVGKNVDRITFTEWMSNLSNRYNMGWRAQLREETVKQDMGIPEGPAHSLTPRPDGTVFAGHILMPAHVASTIGEYFIGVVNKSLLEGTPLTANTISWFEKLVEIRPEWEEWINEMITGKKKDGSWKD
jgi:hypothetical protein